ncbi:hypothetical protein K458DRAFT_384000 [Lentithecium fluviatile CBS 122367]|uniref:Uncharacterized protein n=1 Tax=Lentithecium fluviatile CBS 122367 TaxID=1168545 RepID=A0A6G1JGK1_9PLEO|nr:hypothetical protein K458DRAFT_384000 [Lentithecium fluviatile CBS 122367]
MKTLANVEYEEQCRRNRAEDRIASLPQDKREAAQAEEIKTQRRWNLAMEAKLEQGQAGSTKTSNMYQNPQLLSAAASAPTVQNALPQALNAALNNGKAPRSHFKGVHFPLRFKLKR